MHYIEINRSSYLQWLGSQKENSSQSEAWRAWCWLTSCFFKIKATYSNLRIPVSTKLVLRHLQMQMSFWLWKSYPFPDASLFGFLRINISGFLKVTSIFFSQRRIFLVFFLNLRGGLCHEYQHLKQHHHHCPHQIW